MLKLLRNKLIKGDKGIWMIFFLLCCISLVEIYSASSSLTYTKGNYWDPMIRQAEFLFAGLVIVLIVHRIPCKLFMLFPFILYPISLVLLIYVLFCGGTINGGNRWIELGAFSFQPSEVAKAALIMTLAVILSKTQQEESVEMKNGDVKKIVRATKGGFNHPFKLCCLAIILICGFIVTENFSTAAIIFTVSFIMMYIGNIPLSLLLKTIGVLALIGGLGLVFLISIPDETAGHMGKRFLTWKHRIENFTKSDEEKDEKAYDIGDNWQVDNAYIAVANSNVIGLGPGNSIQRDFLSHAESDFIYAIIIEETGVVGGIVVIMLYVILLVRVIKIARKCDRFFPAFLVMGFGIVLVLQALINMGVAVGLLPVTGQPLPLISKGGTSILLTCFYFGVILSISRYAEKVSESKEEPAELALKNETDEYFNNEGME